MARSLRQNLGRLGLDVRTTREVLNEFTGVQNTYLSMFLALGGLGVILGTFGLVAAVLRAALERRGEFALMIAQGFTRRSLAALLLVENAGLLITGLALGTVSALVAVAPEMASVNSRINWTAMAGVLVGILTVGFIACNAAATSVAGGVLIDALRGNAWSFSFVRHSFILRSCLGGGFRLVPMMSRIATARSVPKGFGTARQTFPRRNIVATAAFSPHPNPSRRRSGQASPQGRGG